MVLQLRVDVPSVIGELDVALAVLTEAKVTSRYRKVFKGKGLDFEDYRKYSPTDDDASRIDWKASVRANKLLIREFREERDIDVFFVVDVSSSMLFGSTEKLKYEYAAELAAALSHFVLESGDRAALLMFSDRVVNFVEPRKGGKHFYVMLSHLLNPKFYGGKYKLTPVMDFIMRTVKDKSMMFLISDFIGLESDWERAVRMATGKVDGVAIMVRDPRDLKLHPDSGQVVIADPYSGKEMLVDCGDDMRIDYENLVRREKERMEDFFQSIDWGFFETTTDKSFVMPLLKYLKRREILLR
jgi:uncharacterized protein (DUF58 family)